MNFSGQYIPYEHTNAFSEIIRDYISNVPALHEFYQHSPDMAGIKKAIAARRQYQTNRKLLTQELLKQYDGIKTSENVESNINSLLSENTFTICTAHQPNIFTGHLYFIYKILHAIRLADELNQEFSDYHFVPVYYMGSEDADLEELGEISINGRKYEWKTDQKGAVGRMRIDQPFIELIEQIEGQVLVEKYGKEITGILRECYTLGKTIEQATFELVNKLFMKSGLLVFLPDNPALKHEFYRVNRKELWEQFSSKIVRETISALPEKYKIQAAGRDINLFYLKDDIRERIEIYKEGYAIANTTIIFSKEQLCEELKNHPERFSPNVILRPVFQELVLPNIVFIGGGGELAYWLELKKVFEASEVPYPVLVLRNSVMVVNKKLAESITKLNFSTQDFFRPERELIDELVKRESGLRLNLEDEKSSIIKIYSQVSSGALAVDLSLKRHVDALCKQALNRLQLLEKKMMKAERKKFEAGQRQIVKIKSALYPDQNLQERVDNLIPYYAIWGSDFIKMLYEYSRGLRMEFCIVQEN